MEEVWKDIIPSSVNDIISTTASNPTFPSTIFQDFLSRPFNNEPPTRPSNQDTSSFSFLSHPSATILSLNSGSGFQFTTSVSSNSAVNSRTTAVPTPSLGASNNSTFHGFGNQQSLLFAERRAQENIENDDIRQHKLMKYRESAARSRARKQASGDIIIIRVPQAYRMELELEVARLRGENSKLRKHNEKVM
ncbi:hypothetical protein V6N11_052996 [Hibiscus sabdariffa]|uniref:BZIP domain-containing protein n=1 Tax=Hibiscus sabdariffa TaxID=183260 RepID=A0ABR2UBR0_9ROSI